jgi:hypothetical protein
MLSFVVEGAAVSATVPTCIYALSDIHANYQALKDALAIVVPRLDADHDEYWQVDAVGDHRVEPYKPGM